MTDKICEAIQNKKLVDFYYDGLQRIVEPHTYGVSKTGKDTLSGYQIRGQSNSDIPTWKLFTLDKISSFSVLDETFDRAESGYSRRGIRMTRIYCEL